MLFKSITGLVVLSALFIFTHSIHGQEDSLLKKISEMDVSIDSTDDSLEDLYNISVSYQSFYDELAPSGEWLKITKDETDEDLKDGEGQGFASDIIRADEIELYIWHPTGMDSDWHPYTNGRWVYTTQGWMWASNYSWGWAVYHYGRWWNSKNFGWVWIPGHVWAPAWVRWKVTEGHIGWCPLTPYAKWNAYVGIDASNYRYNNRDEDWVFIQKNGFIDEISKSNIIGADKNSTYISKAKDIIDIRAENSKINNFGPDVKDIESKSGKSIETRDIIISGEKGNAIVGDKDVTVYRQPFKKLKLDPDARKPQLDRPRLFKVASKIKRHKIQRRIRRRIHRRRF